MSATFTGTIYRPSGAPWANAVMGWRLQKAFATGSNGVAPDQGNATANGSGVITLTVETPPDGGGAAAYVFELPGGQTVAMNVSHCATARPISEIFQAASSQPAQSALQQHNSDPAAHPVFTTVKLSELSPTPAAGHHIVMEGRRYVYVGSDDMPAVGMCVEVIDSNAKVVRMQTAGIYECTPLNNVSSNFIGNRIAAINFVEPNNRSTIIEQVAGDEDSHVFLGWTIPGTKKIQLSLNPYIT